MGKYIIRRLILIIPTLWLLTLLIFGLMRVLPGDVAVMILSDPAGGMTANRETLDSLREKLGLNKPLHIQYLEWVWGMVRGDLGDSLFSGRPVLQDILVRLPVTVEIALLATLVGFFTGIPLGILSAIKQNSWIDQTLRFVSIIFLATPSFWLGLLVILAGLIWFGWVPPSGYNTLWERPKDNILQVMWPVLILGSGGMATIARMTRSTMLEVLREDYIRTARSKGLREQVIIIRHALKNALIPVVTLAGLTFAQLMGGTVILEAIFGVPGMGNLFITSIRTLDYPIVQAITVIFAVLFMATNLLIDLLYGWLDPRISYS
ncbi:MAG: ABC transporter permease [Chloroflexota bacterium]